MTDPSRGLLSLDGKVAVVTGAAGQLGTAFADHLETAGATVVRTDLQPREGFIPLDVSDEASVVAAVGQIEDLYGRIDVLVNNAGIGVYSPLEERVAREVTEVLAVNVMGVVLCTKAAASKMPSGGSVINIGSIYGLVSPDPRIYGSSGRNSSEVYGAAKAGVIQLTRWFSVHLAKRGIRVNSISPGGVFANQDPGFVEEYRKRTPLGRMATPDDLRGGLLYLASDASAYVTGHNLVIDGGWSAW